MAIEIGAAASAAPAMPERVAASGDEVNSSDEDEQGTGAGGGAAEEEGEAPIKPVQCDAGPESEDKHNGPRNNTTTTAAAAQLQRPKPLEWAGMTKKQRRNWLRRKH